MYINSPTPVARDHTMIEADQLTFGVEIETITAANTSPRTGSTWASPATECRCGAGTRSPRSRPGRKRTGGGPSGAAGTEGRSGATRSHSRSLSSASVRASGMANLGVRRWCQNHARVAATPVTKPALANPLYSIKKWDRTKWESDPDRRNSLVTPPQEQAV